LGAGILIDGDRAVSQLHQLGVEHLRAGAIAAGFRLVICE
jgi:hypothetical protein